MNLANWSVIVVLIIGVIMYAISLYYGFKKDPSVKVKFLKFMSLGLLSQAIASGIIVSFSNLSAVSREMAEAINIAFYAFLIFSGLYYTTYNYAKNRYFKKVEKK